MKTYTAMIVGLALCGSSLAMAGGMSGADAMATLNPDKVEGKDVFDTSGGQLGDVDEVVKGSDGQHMVVIGLENSTREVVIPIDRLSMSADGKTLTTTMTRQQLETLPDYDPGDRESVEE